MGPRYAGARQFRQAVDDRLKAQARREGVEVAELRRRFVVECFTARVFSEPECPWLVKGGTALFLRLPVARFSRDLDLSHAEAADTDAAVSDLQRRVAAAGHRDPFVFDITASKELSGAQGVKLKVTTRLGQTHFESFPIDLTVGLEVAGTPESRTRALSIDIDDVEELPAVQVYPLSDHVADKVAGICELSAGRPSSRYRDLIDLALITADSAGLNQVEIAVSLQIQQVRRSEFTIPSALEAPAPQWPANYAAMAAKTGLGPRSFDAAMEQVNTALRPAFHWARTSTRAELEAHLSAGHDGDPMGAAFSALPAKHTSASAVSSAEMRRPTAPPHRKGPHR